MDCNSGETSFYCYNPIIFFADLDIIFSLSKYRIATKNLQYPEKFMKIYFVLLRFIFLIDYNQQLNCLLHNEFHLINKHNISICFFPIH